MTHGAWPSTGLGHEAAPFGGTLYRPGRVWAPLLLALSLSALGCGDDSGTDDPSDGGADSGGDDGTGGGFSPRRPDAQVIGGDAVPPCDRLDPLSCGGGQECEVVVRRAVGEDTFSVYDGCIDNRLTRRGEGEPCEPFGGFLIPYSTQGLEDEVFVDPCDVGLFCAPDPDVRNSNSCQRGCISGALACGSPNEFCLGPDPFRQVCVPSDACDPSDPTACGPGAGCYLRLGDEGDRVLTVCLPTQDPVVGDGDVCSLISDCNPGSSCFGPTRLPPSRWVAEDLLCRRTCIPGQGGDDGGMADDGDGGGGSGGGCPGDQECVPFEESGLDSSTIPVTFGQCE